MNKKMIVIIVIVILVIIGGTIFTIKNNDKAHHINKSLNSNHEKERMGTEDQPEKEDKENSISVAKTKSLVLYFSATGTTKKVAKMIQGATKSDSIEIVPKQKYTNEDLSYTNANCRANKEQNDDSTRPAIFNTIDISKYDIIYLGYPIWWGDVPKIILTLLDNYDLNNKTIIPFCTSGSSGIAQSMNTLKFYNKNIKWIDGKRFNASSSKDDIKSWIDSLNIN